MHTNTRTHRYTHVRAHMWSDAPLPLLRVQSQATSPLHQPLSLLFLCSAFPSLCVTFLLWMGPQSSPIIFGLFIWLAFEPGFSVNSIAITHRHTHTDELTDVKIHSIYDTSGLIGFQHSSLSTKNTYTVLKWTTVSLSHYFFFFYEPTQINNMKKMGKNLNKGVALFDAFQGRFS